MSIDESNSSENVRDIHLAIVGFGGVGKTAITVQYVNDDKIFVEEYDPTVEDSYVVRRTFQGEPVNIHILDTSGQEEFAAMRDVYMQSSQGFILVYAINDRLSFDNLEELITQLRRVKGQEFVPCVLVENKIDLESERKVSVKEGQDLALQLNCPFISSSAKLGLNVIQSFHLVLQKCMNFQMPGRVGWLWKKGGGTTLFSRRNWNKRWFQLEGKEFTYRKFPGSKVLGSIDLADVTNIVLDDKLSYEFSLVTPERVFNMRADNTEELEIWMVQLKALVSSNGFIAD